MTAEKRSPGGDLEVAMRLIVFFREIVSFRSKLVFDFSLFVELFDI